MSDRKDHIKNLKLLMDFLQNNNVFTLTKEMTDSLRVAIQSLEVDEAYQLEYEGMTERGCDRNICIRNEYNIVSCDECEVTQANSSIIKHSATIENHGMGKNKSFDFFKKSVANLPPWISVKDRLPDEDGVYLVSYDNGDILTSWFDLKNTQFNFFHESVLAWMPLPQPYKVKNQERNTDDSRG